MTVQYDATELDIEQLMLRIKESAAKRKLAARPSPLKSGAWAYSLLSHRPQSRLEADLPDLKLTPEFNPHKDNHYHVNDLLKFHDRHFIRIAYRAILKREADDQGFRDYLERLRSGNRNKIDILASLRFSTEGRQRKVRVDGLRLPATVRVISRVPILGYFLQVLIGILRIPVSIRERRRFESYSLIQTQELADYANRLAGILREFRLFINELPAEMAEQRHLTALLSQQQKQLTALLEQQQQKLGLQENELLEHANVLAELSAAVTTQRILGEGLNTHLLDNGKTLSAHSEEMQRLALAMERIKIDLTVQQARTASLIKAIDKSLPVTPKQSDIVREEDGHMLDVLYVSLEDHFRGGRSEIKERFEIYLPYLEQAGITTDILDLGCGRGEWLELLKEKGFHARGVDANRLMAEQCQAAGLKVTCGNAIDHLRSLPDNAVSAVTTFHVIEHLGFKALVELIDEIVRTLRPGGLMVLETPNPENIIVGSCNFYLDPTHRHPLPIQTTKFLLEARGLSDLKVLGLHTLESSRVQGNSELINRFNEFFYGPMDYAIIAHKNINDFCLSL
jgi:SAM-dependent methyltransferase